MSGSTLRLGPDFRQRERPGIAFTILAITSIYLALGALALVTSSATGNLAWVVNFFRGAGAVLLVWLALIEFALAIRVRQHFQPGEALYRAWIWMSISAFFGLLSAVCAQILSLKGGINLLARIPGWSDGTADFFREFGLILGGTIRYGLLAAGLFGALQAYRRAGFPGRLHLPDWAVLAAGGAYVSREFAVVAMAMLHGKRTSFVEVAKWPVDPMLILLLCQALLLNRSVRDLGPGQVSRCWRAYSVGVFLVLAGDWGMWLTLYGYLVWPWSSAVWYVWIPAACAFALAPAYQLDTIEHAVTAGGRP